MKKIKPILIVCFLLIARFELHAQLNTYSKVYYDSTEVGFRAHFSIPTPENGYLIGGSYSTNYGHVLKVDSDGVVIWNKQFNSSSVLYPEINFNSIASTTDSCFVLAGKAFTSLSTSNALLTKINGNGDIIWTRSISQAGYSLAIYSIQQTIDSGFILTGSAENNSNSYRIFVAKINSNGILTWLKIYDYSNSTGISVKQMPDSGYIVIGGADPNKGIESSFFLLKILQAGNIDWAKKYTQPNCLGFDVLVTKNNLFCYYNNTKSGLLKTDLSGNIIWVKNYGRSFFQKGSDIPKIHLLQDGSFFIPSGSYLIGGFINKIDSSGNIKFIKDLQLNPLEIWETKSKNLAIIGNGPMFGIKTTGYNAPQIGLIKADSLGIAANCIFNDIPNSNIPSLASNNLTFTKIDGGKDTSMILTSRNMPVLTQTRCVTIISGVSKNELINTIQISPNPSSGIFKLSEANSKTYKIAIYDIYSNCIYNGIIKSNEDQIELINKASGIYFYKLESAKGIMYTGKIVIEK